MDEFILNQAPGAGNEAPKTEFFLATVVAWSNADGVKIRLDGESQIMAKGYNMMYIPRPLPIGARVIVMKQSGTYIVLGEIGRPQGWRRIVDLSSSASLADVINQVNALLQWLRSLGILWES